MKKTDDWKIIDPLVSTVRTSIYHKYQWRRPDLYRQGKKSQHYLSFVLDFMDTTCEKTQIFKNALFLLFFGIDRIRITCRNHRYLVLVGRFYLQNMDLF